MSTHLLDRLIRDGHIVTSAARNEIPSQHEVTPLGMGAEAFPSSIGVVVEQEERRRGEVHEERRKVQRVCCLALCGIHLGPLRYLSTSTLVGPYLQVCVFFGCCFLGLETHYYSMFSISNQRPQESCSSSRIRRVRCQRRTWRLCRMFLIMG